MARTAFSVLSLLLFFCVIVSPPGRTMDQQYTFNQSANSVQLVLTANSRQLHAAVKIRFRLKTLLVPSSCWLSNMCF